MNKYKLLIVVLFLLNMVDLAATSFLSHRFGPDGELNPLMRLLLEQGILEFALAKFALSLLSCVMFWVLFPLNERASKVAIVFCTSVYALLGLYYVFGMAYLFL